MKSYGFTLGLSSTLQKIEQQESSVIRGGGFAGLRGLKRFRLASPDSRVARVDDFHLILGSDSFPLRERRRSDSQGSFIRPASSRFYQTARTSRDAPTGHKLFNHDSISLQPRRWAHI